MKHTTINRLLFGYIIGTGLWFIDWKTSVIVTAMVGMAHILIVAEKIIKQ